VSFSELFDKVKAALPTASVVFGEREIGKQINQGPGRANRVVFVPGEDSGALGTFDPPAVPGRNLQVRGAPGRRQSRALWAWKVAGRVYVWAYDATDPNDERKQWDALVALHEQVVEAIHAYQSGHYALRAPRLTTKTHERKFGCEIMFVVDLSQPVLSADRQRTGVLENDGGSVLGQSGTEQG